MKKRAGALFRSEMLAPIVRFAPYYGLILAVLIFYGNIFDNGWLYDDQYLINGNAALGDWGALKKAFTHYSSSREGVGVFYRPLQILAYTVVYHAVGLSLFGFHFLNLIFHAANACFVYTLGRKLKFSPFATFASTLIWAVDPIHVEAVTYMSATADVLYAFFSLAALTAIVPTYKSRNIWIAAVLMAFALLAKESAIILPALATVTLGFAQPEKPRLKTYFILWPLWGVAGAYLALRFWLLPFHPSQFLNDDPVSVVYGAHLSVRFLTALATLPTYGEMIVWPHALHMNRSFPIQLDISSGLVAAGAGIVLAAIAFVVAARKKEAKPFAWGLVWFAAAHATQSGVIVPVNALVLEHWMYLPTIGLYLGAAQSLSLVLEAHASNPKALRQMTAVFSLSVALVFGILTYKQNEIWHDPFKFYGNILEYSPKSPRAHNNLGLAYMDKGDYKPAIDQFLEASRDDDRDPLAPTNIGVLFTKISQAPAQMHTAVDWFKKALLLDPLYLPACEDLVQVYRALGETENADHYAKRAYEIKQHTNEQAFDGNS